MKDIFILSINPGSTTTKIAVYNREIAIFTETIQHSVDDIYKFEKITDQYKFRKDIILKEIESHGINLSDIVCIVGIGGLLEPIKSGVYNINKAMLKDLRLNTYGEHASNLGGLLAYDIAQSLPNTKAFITDPVVVDELEDIARFSGHPNIERHSIFHALNQKATGRHFASEIGKPYETLNLIIAHLGGGISVGAHKNGRVIDVNDGLNGEGTFSPERSGGLTALSVAELCFNENYSLKDIKKMVIGHGGIVAYLGTNSIKDVEISIRNGDKKAEKVLNAMSYQISKDIGAMATVLKGKVDAILITGGVAHCKRVTDFIIEQVNYLAPVKIYPGEDELKSLALNGLRVITRETKALDYIKL